MFVRVVLPGTAVLVATHEGAADVPPEETSLAQRKLAKKDRKRIKELSEKEREERWKKNRKKKRSKEEIIHGNHDLPRLRLASRDSPRSFSSFFRANTWNLRRPVTELKRLLGIYMEDGLSVGPIVFSTGKCRDAFVCTYANVYSSTCVFEMRQIEFPGVLK